MKDVKMFIKAKKRKKLIKKLILMTIVVVVEYLFLLQRLQYLILNLLR